jgi:tRNA(fMet)-specific endonuclease VapC
MIFAQTDLVVGDLKMAYLIDTDIIIYSLKNVQTVIDNFKKYSNLPKAISVVTYGELIFGARKSAYPEKNMAIAHRTSELFQVIDCTKSVMETFGELKAMLQKKGTLLDDMDLLIGSTALVTNYTLVTNNTSHFKRIPGIKLENWFQ